jgi:hypothetical protein
VAAILVDTRAAVAAPVQCVLSAQMQGAVDDTFSFDHAALVHLIVPLAARAAHSPQIYTLKITTLVTNVAGNPHQGDGEWGWCCRTIMGITSQG